jgi:hypothetical protein
MADNLDDLLQQLDKIAYTDSDEVWVTRDKRRIFIKDMSNTHLINALHFMRRAVQQYLYKLCKGPGPADWRACLSGTRRRVLENMEAEALKRGIDWMKEHPRKDIKYKNKLDKK